MAKYVPGRTDNQIKNRYNSNLKKRFQDKEFVRLYENRAEMQSSYQQISQASETSSKDQRD